MRSTKELRSARAAIFTGAILTVLAAAAIFFVMHMGDNKNLSERERQADSASASRAESILAESAEQRTVPTAERAAAVLAESVQ